MIRPIAPTCRIIEIFGTGMLYGAGHRVYIGTVFVDDYVWHIYEFLGFIKAPGKDIP